MNELAVNSDGERFEVPPQVVEWKVLGWKQPGRPGAPETIYGANGFPLYVPVGASMEEFREAVGNAPAKYKLLPVDAHRKGVPTVQPGYLQLGEPRAQRADVHDDRDHVRELVRIQGDMVRTIAERFASIMDSAATLIRAADGAGLPSREPVAAVPASPPVAAPEPVVEPAPPAPAGLGWFLADTLGKAGPLLNHLILTKVAGLSPEQALAFMGGATAQAQQLAAPAAAPPPGDSATPSAAPPSPTATPPAAPPVTDFVAHLNAIERLLSPHEAAAARTRIQAMAPAAIMAWRERIASMSAADAAVMIRGEIAESAGGAPRAAGGAS